MRFEPLTEAGDGDRCAFCGGSTEGGTVRPIWYLADSEGGQHAFCCFPPKQRTPSCPVKTFIGALVVKRVWNFSDPKNYPVGVDFIAGEFSPRDKRMFYGPFPIVQIG